MGNGRPARFISVGSRLALATSIVLSLATAAVFVGLSRFARARMISAKETAARMAGELFLRSASTPVLFDDVTGIRDTVALLLHDPEVLGVEIWRAAPGHQAGERIAAQLKPAGEPGVPPRYTERGSIERTRNRVVLRDAIRDQDGKILATVAVQYSLARENRDFAALRRQILVYAAGVGALVALLLWSVTRRWITRPLGRLLDAVKQVEAGERVDLDPREAPGEVGRLAEAFGRMAHAVTRREHDITRRNNDMKLIMDNIAQGLLRVTREGALLPEHSAILDAWFGPWQAGAPLWTYLAPAAPRAAATIEMLWSNLLDDILPLELGLTQMPARLDTGGRTYALAFQAIGRGAEQSVLIVVSDITAEVEGERGKVGQQELLSLFQWMVNDRAGLMEYFTDAERLLRSITSQGTAEAGTAEEARDLTELRREVHTLKGNSGLFGLTSMVAVCQTIEERLEEGEQGLAPEDREALLGTWGQVERRRRQLFGDETRRRVEIDEEEHRGLLESVVRGTPHAEIEAQLRAFALEPAKQRLARVGEQARALAQRLGKGEITVLIEANGIRLPEQPLGEFFAAFAHLVRNAVDHGLETPAEREEAGKSPAGSLQLRTLRLGQRFLVEIEDDGRGINWKRLKERAQEAGFPAETREDLVEALFADGVSTRESVTEISGRGVGMSAVRAACERSGGQIRVQSEPGAGTRFQFSWPLSILQDPAAAPAMPPGSNGPRVPSLPAGA